MRCSLLALLVLSCAHAAPPPKLEKTEPAKAPETKPAPPPDDPRACTTVTPELTLGPLPAAELNHVGKDDFITLHRGACFGRCPIYSVTVHADGRVTAIGERHVAQTGEQSWQIDPTVAKRLLAELVRMHVATLEPKMSVHVSDLPTARLDGKLGTRTVALKHYGAGAELSMGFGDRDAETATRLERLIDLISEAESRIVGCAAKL
jgi:hypothetical protein